MSSDIQQTNEEFVREFAEAHIDGPMADRAVVAALLLEAINAKDSAHKQQIQRLERERDLFKRVYDAAATLPTTLPSEMHAKYMSYTAKRVRNVIAACSAATDSLTQSPTQDQATPQQEGNAQ